MKYFDMLSPEERVEVEAAVHDAFVRDDDGIRTLMEADAEFDRYVTDAVQAHRPWAALLLDAWRDEGRRAFLKDRWKNSDVFALTYRGKLRRRQKNRGTQVRDAEGRQGWVQAPLEFWTADQLRRAISESARRIEEERANIAMYRALLDLLEQTGQATVENGLQIVGMTLQEYLAQQAA